LARSGPVGVPGLSADADHVLSDGRLHHIGIGRTHIIMLVQDMHIRVVNAAAGELPAN
jgi:hypothetical protein